MKQKQSVMKGKSSNDGFVLGCILMCLLSCSLSAQTNTGPKTSSVVTSASCSFSYSSLLNYAPVTNVQSSDNIYASAIHCGCCDANTNCLRLTNFGFNIPAGASITGIIVDIEKRSDFGAHIEDNGLRLLNGGVETGNNNANFGLQWPWTDTKVTYGGCNDLWGSAWTPAQINAPSFGLVFASIDYTCGGDVLSYIDEISISVCYVVPLPLEYLRFNAFQKEEKAELNWSISKQTEAGIVIVERSDESGVFQPLDSVKIALSDEAMFSEYKWTDPKPLKGSNYYRLKVRKHDYTYHYSPIHQLVFYSSDIGLFPNPAGETIVLEGKSQSETSFIMYNAAQESVLSKYWVSFPAEVKQREIGIGHLPDGIYYCKWQTPDTIKWFKLIKQSDR